MTVSTSEPARRTPPAASDGDDEGEGPTLPLPVLVVAVAVTAVLAATLVLVGQRWLAGRGRAENPASLAAQPIALPGESPLGAAAGRAGGPVPGSTSLSLIGPLTLVDSRNAGHLAPGASATLPLPALPPGTTAVLLEVSVIEAAGPGAVTVHSEVGDVVALRVPKAGAQTSTTVVSAIGRDGGVRVTTEGGGHILVNLVGALVPADSSSAGRIVPVPPAEAVHLVPATDGKDTHVDVASVPALRDAGGVAAVLLSVAADVGVNGGRMAVGPAPDQLHQEAFWSATSGSDRTRYAFMVVPVERGVIHMHYEAGSDLRADIVGYVTDASAPRTIAGLLIPRGPAPVGPTTVAAGQTAEVGAVGAGDPVPPADRVAAALFTVSATGDAPGAVTVQAPDAAAPARPTLVAPGGSARTVVALVDAPGGKVRIASEAGAAVTLTPQAVILRG